jgi:uncharacterized protein
LAVVTKESIQVLFEIQTRDTAIDRLKNALALVPDEIQLLRKTVEAERAKAEELKNESKKLQVERKNKEVELASKEELISKHQRELNSVKSNEAFKALQHEIDQAKSEKGALEEQVLALMERTDELARGEKTEAKRVEAHRVEIEAQVRKLEADAETLKTEIASKTAERDGVAAQAAPEMLKQYESLRARRSGVALVPVRAGSCGGCNLKLTPQTLVDVKKHSKLVLCEGCQRILFDKDPS